MNDGWTDSNGDSLPSDWTPGGPLTPADEWSSGCGCAPPDGPAIANSVTIIGSPGAVTSVQNGKSLWSLVLNDGTPAADFRLDRFDDTGALASSPMSIVRATGVVTFHDPVMLAADPLEDMEAATKLYVDEHASGIEEAPIDNTTYGRDNGTWVALPASYMPEAPNTSTRFGRFNSTWQPDAIQVDAPNDGGAYARQSGAWTAAVTGGPYLPLAGGTISGVLNLPPNNQVYINGPLNSTTNIIGQRAGNLVRWSMALGDSATEGAGNSGCNFRLDAYGAAGAYLGTPLTISRNGDFNLTGSMAVNGMFALQGPGYFNLPGGANGQVLSTNGAGLLSWIAPAAGGIAEAPNDGTAYARKSAAWAHLTHADITDWAATLANYLPLSGGTITGALAVNGAATFAGNPVKFSLPAGAGVANFPVIDAPAGNARSLLGTTAGSPRWRMTLGNGVAESGANAGSDFGLSSYDDSGATINTPFTIARSNGAVNIVAVGSAPYAGTAGMNVGAAGLFLNKAAGANGLQVSGTTNGSLRWQLVLGDASAETGGNQGSSFVLNRFSDAGVNLGVVMSSGRVGGVVTFTSAIVNGPSDRTLKENIEPIEGALDKVNALQGVSFNLIATPEKREIGLIAQDVEPVVPEIMQVFQTHDEEGRASGTKLALDYPKLTALLIEAVKSLTARVAALEAANG
jgi:hypothetical protein